MGWDGRLSFLLSSIGGRGGKEHRKEKRKGVFYIQRAPLIPLTTSYLC
jgi:hypothetical protein